MSFDARNLGTDLNITDPIPGVFNKDGTPLTAKYEGRSYFRWDHALEKLVVDTILLGEQDSDSKSTVVNFLTHALLTDCVAQGAQDYMYYILSSHGGGYAGFGGDEFQVR